MPTNIAARHFLLGKLRKGSPKTANRQGQNLDHFRFQIIEGSIQSEYAAGLFKAFYGDEPKQVNILLCGDTPEMAFDDWFLAYGNSKQGNKPFLKRKCTGEEVVSYFPPDGYQLVSKGDRAYQPMPCQRMQEGICDCKQTGTLRFFIEELLLHGLTSPMEMETHSFDDIGTIKQVLQDAYELLAVMGRSLHRARFILERQKVSIPAPQFDQDRQRVAGRRSRMDTWGVRIRPNPDWLQSLMAAAYQGRNESFFMPKDANFLPLTEGPSLLRPAQTLTKEEANALDNLRKEHGWSNQACIALIKSIGVSRWSEVPISKVQQLVDVIRSEQLRQQWEQFALNQGDKNV